MKVLPRTNHLISPMLQPLQTLQNMRMELKKKKTFASVSFLELIPEKGLTVRSKGERVRFPTVILFVAS